MTETEKRLAQELDLAWFWINVLIHDGDIDINDSVCEKLNEKGAVIEVRQLRDIMVSIPATLAAVGIDPGTFGPSPTTPPSPHGVKQ